MAHHNSRWTFTALLFIGLYMFLALPTFVTFIGSGLRLPCE